jgi:hypothetical protein
MERLRRGSLTPKLQNPGLLGMGNRHCLKTGWLHRVDDLESKRLEGAALKLWKTSRLSFDKPLPGKPPNIPDRLSAFAKSRICIL